MHTIIARRPRRFHIPKGRSRAVLAALVGALTLGSGCADDGDGPSLPIEDGGMQDAHTEGGMDDGDAGGDPLVQQLERGASAFDQHCAECHGDSGMGTNLAPPLVGPDALPLEPPEERTVRTEEFRTAEDVFEFASANMPFDDPGSLSDDMYLDIVAFALDANDIELSEPLDTDNAADVEVN